MPIAGYFYLLCFQASIEITIPGQLYPKRTALPLTRVHAAPSLRQEITLTAAVFSTREAKHYFTHQKNIWKKQLILPFRALITAAVVAATTVKAAMGPFSGI